MLKAADSTHGHNTGYSYSSSNFGIPSL